MVEETDLGGLELLLVLQPSKQGHSSAPLDRIFQGCHVLNTPGMHQLKQQGRNKQGVLVQDILPTQGGLNEIWWVSYWGCMSNVLSL